MPRQPPSPCARAGSDRRRYPTAIPDGDTRRRYPTAIPDGDTRRQVPIGDWCCEPCLEKIVQARCCRRCSAPRPLPEARRCTSRVAPHWWARCTLRQARGIAVPLVGAVSMPLPCHSVLSLRCSANRTTSHTALFTPSFTVQPAACGAQRAEAATSNVRRAPCLATLHPAGGGRGLRRGRRRAAAGLAVPLRGACAAAARTHITNAPLRLLHARGRR
jgi:hypothetical protein